MFNKGLCRGCGVYLTPISVCTICKEYISWICGKCERMDDVTHFHPSLQSLMQNQERVIKKLN
jgi:hypothetical protein